MQIDSISSFRIYSSWMSQSAKINNVKAISKDEGNDETALMQQQLDAVVETTEKVQQSKQSLSQKSVASLPWAHLMYELNLTPTGDYTKDYNATISRLDELIKYTQNPDKLQEYLSLADEVSIAFVQPQVSSTLKNNSSLSGTEQIAQLNKVMMLNLKAK